jgi:hypothetical protein
MPPKSYDRIPFVKTRPTINNMMTQQCFHYICRIFRPLSRLKPWPSVTDVMLLFLTFWIYPRVHCANFSIVSQIFVIHPLNWIYLKDFSQFQNPGTYSIQNLATYEVVNDFLGFFRISNLWTEKIKKTYYVLKWWNILFRVLSSLDLVQWQWVHVFFYRFLIHWTCLSSTSEGVFWGFI